MTCPAHLDGHPDGLLCTVEGDHETHVFEASDAPDRHTISEPGAES